MNVKSVRTVCWLLTAMMFAYNFYIWGGLATTPLGGKLRHQASINSPLAATYLVVGRHLVSVTGNARSANDAAHKAFYALLAGPEPSRHLLVESALAAQSDKARLTYSGAPLLLLLSLALHVTRQKQVRSWGKRS